MTIKECLENGVMDLEDEVDYNDTPEAEENACLRLEIERLNNIINELEKWLVEDLKQQYRDCGHRNNIVREVYEKLKELKEENDN